MNALRLVVAPIVFLFIVLGHPALASSASSADTAVEGRAKQIWQLLDYMAVDYAGAVAGGKVINADEYAEMQEFGQTIERQLADMPEKPGKSGLLQQTLKLKAAVVSKADARDVADQANRLAADLLAAYPVPVAPAKVPDLQRGAALYQAQCASCHGADGRGDGPLSAKLEPPPIAFTDRERARERSLFSLHQSITLGVEGTTMPSFMALNDDERWTLAFYISTMSFTKDEVEEGKKLWTSDPSLRTAIPNLDTLTQLSESGLEKNVPPKKASALIAYLRSEPQAVGVSHEGSLALARTRLKESLAALEKGDASNAARLALTAYLDGFEPVEPALAIKSKDSLQEIEQTMGAYRAAIAQGNIDSARQIETRLQEHLAKAQSILDEASDDKWGVFLGALTILLREGLEALLVVVAMIAFLKKAERQEVLPYVHAGWITALAAGGLTWFAATYLIEVSGASRELTEGFSAIFAAVVLLAVGIWMHQKSFAGRWQTYIRQKLSAALNKRSAAMLFVLAFVTVYREVFETVLFYAALWTEGTGMYLLAGLALGGVILAVAAAIILRTSARLPIGQFFSVSAALIAVLAVVLIGKGVAALQEAGMLGVTPIQVPQVDLLGLYPSLQTVTAQVTVLLIITGSMFFNVYMYRKHR